MKSHNIGLKMLLESGVQIKGLRLIGATISKLKEENGQEILIRKTMVKELKQGSTRILSLEFRKIKYMKFHISRTRRQQEVKRTKKKPLI